MESLLPNISTQLNQHQVCVLVTITEISGSSPRSPGTNMLITQHQSFGSIGGGNLEYRAISSARAHLANKSEPIWHEEYFGLGPALNQCCGGAVKLLFETLSDENRDWIDTAIQYHCNKETCVIFTDLNRQQRVVLSAENVQSVCQHFKVIPEFLLSHLTPLLDANTSSAAVLVESNERFLLQVFKDEQTSLVIFGAGHVGKAIVKTFSQLPFYITWIDQRIDMFPESVHENVKVHCIAEPTSYLDISTPASFYLVMTHSHELDYELCRIILAKCPSIWLGLIGSTTKRLRFEQRLLKEGIARERVEKLVCPIGLPGISDKTPATIAISVAAQLLKLRPTH